MSRGWRLERQGIQGMGVSKETLSLFVLEPSPCEWELGRVGRTYLLGYILGMDLLEHRPWVGDEEDLPE